MLKNISAGLKKNLIGVITFVVFAMMLVSYFKVYIPKQEQEINSAKFRVLSRIQANMKNKTSGISSQISLFLNKNNQEVKKRLDSITNQPKDSVKRAGMFDIYTKENNPLHLKVDIDTVPQVGKIRFCNYPREFRISLGYICNRSNGDRLYKRTCLSLDVAIPWQSFLNDQLRNDFESYMIIKDAQILFSSDSSIGIDLATDKASVSNSLNYNQLGAKAFDSLYFQGHFHFITPSIDDIYIDGQNYKIFFYPFRMNAQGTMFLCGLVKSSTYNSETKRIPGNIVYILVIVILIFILSFPFLKLVFMSESERLGTKDLIMGIGSIMFLCVAATTSITPQIEDSDQAKMFTDSSCRKLNDNILSKYTGEIDACCYRMKQADSILSFEMHSCDILYPDTCVRTGFFKEADKFLTIDSTGYAKRTLDTSIWAPVLLADKNDPKYKLLNSDNKDFAWFTTKGERSKFWTKSLLNSSPGGNFKTRPYFNHAKNKDGNYIPQRFETKDKYYIEPLISWTTGQFETDISMHSHADSETVLASSIGIQSFLPFIPFGYGFNIIDNKGNVQYSSDSLKDLNENMIQECDDSTEFLSAIHSRTRETFAVNYHTEAITGRIAPMAGTPYFLVTYCNDDFASQRLWYTMLFSYPCIITIFLFIILLVVLISILRKRNSDHNLKTAHFHFDWLWPNASKRKEYIQILLFNFTVILFTIGFVKIGFITHTAAVKENYSIFLIFICFLNALFSFGLLYYLLHGVNAKANHVRVWFSFFLIIVFIEFMALFFYHFFLSISAYLLLLCLAFSLAKYIAARIKESAGKRKFHSKGISDNVSLTTVLREIIKNPGKFTTNTLHQISVTTLCCWIFVSWMFISCIIPCFYFINYSYNQISLRQLKEYQLYYAANYNPAKDYSDGKFVSGTNSDIIIKENSGKSDLGESGQLGNDTLYKKIVELTGLVLYPIQTRALTLGKDFSEDCINLMNKKTTDTLSSYRWSENKKHDSLIFSYSPEPSGVSKSGFKIISPLHRFINPLKEMKYYLVLIIMLFVIYGLIRFLYNRFYTLGFILPANDQEKRLMEMLEDEINYKNILISGIPLSGRLDIIMNKLESMYGKDKILEVNSFINSDYIDAKDKLTSDLLQEKFAIPDMDTTQYKVVLVRRFEYNIKDLVTNRIKLNLVERLLNLSGSPRIIIIPDTEPVSALQSALSFEHHTMDEALKKEMQGDLERWTILLTQFHNAYFYKVNAPVLNKALPDWAREVINHECRLGAFMPEVAGMLEQDVLTKRAVDRNEVIWLAQSYSRLYYHSLWSSFSKEEKYIVYDLALDNLLNTKNSNLMNILFQKGIFFTDKAKGNISLFNDSFRNFILTEISKEEIESMNRLAKKKGEWSNFKTPIVIIIAFLLILLTISNGSSVISYITMLITGLALVQRVFLGLNSVGITTVPAK